MAVTFSVAGLCREIPQEECLLLVGRNEGSEQDFWFYSQVPKWGGSGRPGEGDSAPPGLLTRRGSRYSAAARPVKGTDGLCPWWVPAAGHGAPGVVRLSREERDKHHT